jgi:SEC-C motif
MSDKIGRNDPCYCGSGKKYKSCHLKADQAVENERAQLMAGGRWLRRDFLKYARDERFSEAFAIALPLYWNNLYTLENAEEMSQNEAFRFFDWFIFDYQVEDQPRLFETYYKEKYNDLSTYQQQVLDSWMDAGAASAYALLDYEGQMLHLQDFFTGEEYTVYEPGGHGVVEAGDLLLGRIVRIQDQLEFSAVVAYLPKDEIADLAEKMEAAKTAEAETPPEADHEAFLRRNSHLIIHHALAQAKIQGRPPVAALDQNRADEVVRKATRQVRKLQKRK